MRSDEGTICQLTFFGGGGDNTQPKSKMEMFQILAPQGTKYTNFFSMGSFFNLFLSSILVITIVFFRCPNIPNLHRYAGYCILSTYIRMCMSTKRDNKKGKNKCCHRGIDNFCTLSNFFLYILAQQEKKARQKMHFFNTNTGSTLKFLQGETTPYIFLVECAKKMRSLFGYVRM